LDKARQPQKQLSQVYNRGPSLAWSSWRNGTLHKNASVVGATAAIISSMLYTWWYVKKWNIHALDRTSSWVDLEAISLIYSSQMWSLVMLNILTLPSGRMPARQTPSAEATACAQCASPTDLKVDRTSLKLWQTSGGDANGYHSAYPMEE